MVWRRPPAVGSATMASHPVRSGRWRPTDPRETGRPRRRRRSRHLRCSCSSWTGCGPAGSSSEDSPALGRSSRWRSSRSSPGTLRRRRLTSSPPARRRRSARRGGSSVDGDRRAPAPRGRQHRGGGGRRRSLTGDGRQPAARWSRSPATSGWTDIRIPASTAAGRLDIEAFEARSPTWKRWPMSSDDAFGRAPGDAEATDSSGPSPPAIGTPSTRLSRRRDLADRFRDSMRLVTTMFGGEHRYLVCVPALGRPRPGGGAPATVGGPSRDDDGSLELEADRHLLRGPRRHRCLARTGRGRHGPCMEAAECVRDRRVSTGSS